MSKIYQLAQKFNCFYLLGFKKGKCRPFIIEGHQVGLIRSDVLKQLLRFPEVFFVTDDCVELNPAFRDYNERSMNIERVLNQLYKDDVFDALRGWRNECYEVSAEYGTDSLLRMERSATCLFGVRRYGVDINGYVKHPTRGLCIWLQQRSTTKETWPNKWDNIVGGGLSVGLGILETAHKEAREEASIPTHLLKNLVSAGCVSYFFESEQGIFPNTSFTFDLELPVEFEPSNGDGEVQKFELLSTNECIERIITPDFKTTSAPVILDFLIRHGIINAETEKHIAQIVELLHIPIQRIYSYNSSSNNIFNKNGKNVADLTNI